MQESPNGLKSGIFRTAYRGSRLDAPCPVSFAFRSRERRLYDRLHFLPMHSSKVNIPSPFLSLALNCFSALARSSGVAPNGMYSSKLKSESPLASSRWNRTRGD